MAEGHSRHCWAHTSTILALIANVNRDPKKHRPFRPSDFDPTAAAQKSEAIEITPRTIGLLKQAFTGRR